MRYRLFVLLSLFTLVFSTPIVEDDDDDENDDMELGVMDAQFDLENSKMNPQDYLVEIQDLRLLAKLLDHIFPEFLERKANNTICQLHYLKNDENEHFVDMFYLRTLKKTGAKLEEIFAYYDENGVLPADIPTATFVESIWSLVDCDKEHEEAYTEQTHDKVVRLRRQAFPARKKRGTGCMGSSCSSVSPIIAPIFGYGCWCNFDSTLGKGGGKWKDEYDRTCKVLQQCLRCVRMDGPDGTASKCKIRHIGYNSKFVKHYKLYIGCDDLNSGDICAANICKCEENWIENIFGALWSGASFDSQYYHSTFTPDRTSGGNCEKVESHCGSSNNEKCNSSRDCCGVYPTRYPYSRKNEYRQCCDNAILINTNLFGCCGSSHIYGYGMIGNKTSAIRQAAYENPRNAECPVEDMIPNSFGN